ncbi:MAG: hypothetical protein A3I05_06405 [Deltaproteobacteria bacterium RIFCSPLOWO2_02_FULL_44_10]|nr:MAG: hypothetical protein A3C46_01690 [Deltaproteobacteria bacterium RIFCSPHIGHO2_02_FULL_44_16]OGQ46447.1 MAG: hypothetical protein A3I05_06405 [Deltaproteobacteria bacterium RIFCSPLOWO2_02_FULL_44_10]
MRGQAEDMMMTQRLTDMLNVYSDVQRRYFLALFDQKDRKETCVDLSDSDFLFFSSMSVAKRNRYLVDMRALCRNQKLLDQARELRVVVLEMNAGLGTSLDIHATEGESKATAVTFPTTIEEISILEAKFLHALRRRTDFRSFGIIPWNSERTQKGWDRIAKKYVSQFREAEIKFYPHHLQADFPRLKSSSHEPLEEGREEDRFAPGGHGQILYHLYFSGAFKKLADEGIDILVLANSDNISATANPFIAAFLAREKIPAVIVTTDRTDKDIKGGILALFQEQLRLVEIGEILPNQVGFFQSLGLKKNHKTQPFNTNTVYISLPVLLQFLQSMTEDEREQYLVPKLIVNKKRVVVNGIEKEVEQLEGAIGSVVLKFPDTKLINVRVADRISQFAPVKTNKDVEYLYQSGHFFFDLETATLKVCEKAVGGEPRAASSDAGNEASMHSRLKRRQKSGV